MKRETRTLASIALALCALHISGAAQGRQVAPGVASIKGNVVRVESGNRTGFGFLVGIGEREVLLATAWHTLQEIVDDTITVCFAHAGETCRSATIVYIADAVGSQPALDLVMLRAPYPDNLVWRPDVLAPRPPAGEPVWFIGRSGEWYIPNDPGRIAGFDAARQLLVYGGLEVAEGVSGAPIVSTKGIVAMHVESVGGEGDARGVDIHAIRGRLVDGVRAQWLLVPQAQCDVESVHARTLAGRDVVVHFDWRAPDAALQSIAFLNCMGAHGLPRPMWSDEAWPGNSIAYTSGGLRAARALQSVLGSLGRFDTTLSKTGDKLELWIR